MKIFFSVIFVFQKEEFCTWSMDLIRIGPYRGSQFVFLMEPYCKHGPQKKDRYRSDISVISSFFCVKLVNSNSSVD